jgi:hypothetical protein
VGFVGLVIALKSLFSAHDDFVARQRAPKKEDIPDSLFSPELARHIRERMGINVECEDVSGWHTCHENIIKLCSSKVGERIANKTFVVVEPSDFVTNKNRIFRVTYGRDLYYWLVSREKSSDQFMARWTGDAFEKCGSSGEENQRLEGEFLVFAGFESLNSGKVTTYSAN